MEIEFPKSGSFMVPSAPQVRYVACWTENDGVHWCGCDHRTIGAAMACLWPDGRTFIRAWDKGTLRSLTDSELQVFIVESRGRVLKQTQ